MLLKNRIVIQIPADNYNAIITKITRLKINIYKIEIINNSLFLTIDSDDYNKVKHELFLERVSISDYLGYKKIMDITNKYKLIIIGLIASLLFIVCSSLFIVDIEVQHEEESIKQLIYDELENNNVHKYQLKKSYDQLQIIKERIINNNDVIEWMEINVIGMKYVVKVEKKIINKEIKKDDYCNIYAKKPGVIRKIKVYEGTTIYNNNDYVAKDEIIISGDITRDDKLVDQKCASGSVLAETWYKVNLKIPLDYKESRITKKKRYNIILNYNGIDYKLFNDRLDIYDEKKKEIFDLLGLKIYLKTDTKVIKTKKRYTEKNAEKYALKKSKEKVLNKIGKKDSIIMQKVLQKRVKNSTMDIDIFIITEEEIGYQKVLEKREQNVS